MYTLLWSLEFEVWLASLSDMQGKSTQKKDILDAKRMAQELKGTKP